MTRGASGEVGRWCRLCGTEHDSQQRCPQAAFSSEPENRAWRISVETPRGFEGYGVLMCKAGPRWRSRILTFPNVLWVIPGGGESLKFLGRTEDEARSKAVDFIRRHCVAKGYLMRDEIECVDQHRSSVVIGPTVRPGRTQEVATRYRRRLPIRFGRNRPILMGETENLSEGGLFVTTDYPLGRGDLVGLSLDLNYCLIPMRGSVAWSRPSPQPGRPQGMGLRLLNPPTIYLSYVRALD